MMVHSYEMDACGPSLIEFIEIVLTTLVTMLIFRCSFHDIQAQFQFLVMRCFTFNKPSSTISYPISHTQLVSTITNTRIKENKRKQDYEKKLKLTKTNLKDMLEYEQVKEMIKRVSRMKEKSPNF